MAYTRYTQRTAVQWAIADAGQLAYPTHDVDYNVFTHDAVDNGVYISGYAPDAPYVGGKYARTKFKTWLRGATSGTTIPEMILLMACGFDVADQTTSKLYTLADPHLSGEGDGDVVAVDISVVVDKLSHPCEDAVGNVIMHFVAGQLPVLEWEFIGGCGSEAGALAQPSITTANLSEPAACQNYAATINAQTIGILEMHLNVGNRLDPRPDLNGTTGYGTQVITGRVPAYELLIEADTTNVNPMTLYEARTNFHVASITHDSGGGVNNEVDIDFDGVITSTPQKEEGPNGVLCYRFTMTPCLTSDDPLTLDWKDQ
jgi:hypothetical protein